MRKNWFLVKILILFIIFFWIIKSVNTSETIKVLTRINLFYFFIALLLNNLSNLFLTIKWYKLASPLKIKSNFIDLLKLNYISVFYSLFVPGQSSGELIKGLKFSKKEGSHQKTWIPIFIDKITNLLIIFIIGLVGILYDNRLRKNVALVSLVSLLTILASLMTIILFSEKTNEFADILKKGLLKILNFLKIESKSLKEFSLNYFEHYKKNERLIFETIFYSLLTKLPHLIAFYFLALSLNISLSFIQCSWLFSIVFLASILPISFSGLGVREGTILLLLSQLGIQNSTSLSFSMLIFTNGIIIGLIGGFIELFSSLKLKPNT